ncbi:MAG: ankyrin repeat domain-containing protein [Calothrix sp. SM1_5_4]|nr:ankyrin repeat domain-containing protein [Calothrix sp. SM1_5_4]
MMLASLQGHEPVVSYLLTRKANLNAKDVTGMTALMAASKKGHLSLVRVLVEGAPT